MKKLSFSLITLLTFAFPTSAALAQISPDLSSVGQGGLSLTVSPQYPAPGATVNFTLQDFQDDLNVATISWSVSGGQGTKGVGVTRFQTTAGAAGSTQTVTATVTTQNGDTLTKTVTLTPEGLDLLWQAHSYVPPFYRGKALFPYQGTITVSAMPTFALTNPKNAVYTWKLDDQAQPNVSGSGKNTITLMGSVLLKPITVSVTARSPGGSLVAQNTITLTGTNPSVIFYQESPLYGLLLNNAIGSTLSITSQVGLNAAPYFFDSTVPFISNASFTWNINGQTVAGQTGQVLVVAPPENQSGNSTVSVTATNNDKSFQTASANVSASFTNNQ